MKSKAKKNEHIEFEVYTLCTPHVLFLILIPADSCNPVVKVIPRNEDPIGINISGEDLPLD